MPQEVDFVGFENSTFKNCTSVQNRQFTCSGPITDGLGEASIKVIARVINGASGNIVFSARVDPDNNFQETNETNNTAFVSTTVNCPFDFSVSGTANQWIIPNLLSGVTLHFRIINNGPGFSKPVTLRVDVGDGNFTNADTKCPDGTRMVDGHCIPTTSPNFIFCNRTGAGYTCSVSSSIPPNSRSQDLIVSLLTTDLDRNGTATAIVDPDSSVSETNEDNNRFNLSFSIPL